MPSLSVLAARVEKELSAAILEIVQAWEQMLKFGNHEGPCNFSGECEKCGQSLGRCDKHAEHVAQRMNGMTVALNRARALISTASVDKDHEDPCFLRELPAGPPA
jgi:hypothetical protein